MILILVAGLAVAVSSAPDESFVLLSAFISLVSIDYASSRSRSSAADRGRHHEDNQE
jgi:hypothetical protein